MSATNKIWTQIQAEFSCSCEATVIAFKTKSNGVRVFVRQCLTCGKASPELKHATLTGTDKSLALPFNTELQEDWYKRRNDRAAALHAEAQERESEDWWRKYNAYLQTDKWKSKRARVLERDGNLCQACRKRKATEVHHLSYKHVGHEPLFELTSVCGLCHEAITLMDRTRRTENSKQEQGALSNG